MVENGTAFRLWSDEPSHLDLLSFDAVAETVVQAVLDDALDPVALGLSGSWGSGKTTVLNLVNALLNERDKDGEKVLVVATDPWRYDPANGAKESLMSAVLATLGSEVSANSKPGSQALNLLVRLGRRVDWAKALRIAARASLTLQLPSLEDITQLVRPDDENDEMVRGLDEFRKEFAELMASDELKAVVRVVVLLDDLDRCLPETVVETLETIRLFLAVPKMSFVIAADEQRVADAIRTRFPVQDRAPTRAATEGELNPEEPAQLYLHKIVQTAIPIPALSRFDTEAYLILLQLLSRQDFDLSPYIERCALLRRTSGSIDDLTEVTELDISKELSIASRLTPILYEKFRGNPRRIKRFLNDLNVRQTIAAKRGITLDSNVVAKLMVLEVLLHDGFDLVLVWLARGELRERISLLEASAGRGVIASTQEAGTEAGETILASVEPTAEAETEFSEQLIRWAKLPPILSDKDLTPYLHLAAAFSGRTLLDSELPERLRDIAANLLSGIRAEQKSVTEDDLRALTGNDPTLLVQHLGRVARDRPTSQRPAVLGLLRITRIHAATTDEVSKLLMSLPADELEVATILTFSDTDATSFRAVLEGWHSQASQGTIQNALVATLKKVTE